ncbi:hypothetical protein Q8A67_023019 [Cirrhinus molitorella]|uniref:Uncharacterized protein n=1 Tax=Cirrhinus molitorella TaxID=172907 RepID=A0AA88TCN5_9TELE|nr:hypothetical protein Q8A67_023019 [Cirrhinus molitorella]
MFTPKFCKKALRRMSYLHFIEAQENGRHSSRSSRCLHSVTASLDKRRVYVEKLVSERRQKFRRVWNIMMEFWGVSSLDPQD